jgi:hypothetical protein
MSKDLLLVVLTLTGSAFCWWPTLIQPDHHLPVWWNPLIVVALGAGLSTTLSDESWLRFMVASYIGTFSGVLGGYLFLPGIDPIERSYALFAIGLDTVGATLSSFVACLAGLALRDAVASNEGYRRAAWAGLICCVAFGPVALLLTTGTTLRMLKRGANPVLLVPARGVSRITA